MRQSLVRRLFSAGSWRRVCRALREIEVALITTESEIHDKRIARLEAEVAELRVHAGLRPGNAGVSCQP